MSNNEAIVRDSVIDFFSERKGGAFFFKQLCCPFLLLIMSPRLFLISMLLASIRIAASWHKWNGTTQNKYKDVSKTWHKRYRQNNSFVFTQRFGQLFRKFTPILPYQRKSNTTHSVSPLFRSRKISGKKGEVTLRNGLKENPPLRGSSGSGVRNPDWTQNYDQAVKHNVSGGAQTLTASSTSCL